MIMAGGWMLKFLLFFIEATHELYYSRKIKFYTMKDDGRTCVSLYHHIFDETFK
jgi:hypothetical protein